VKWLLKYTHKDGDVIAIQCAFHDIAHAIQEDLISIGCCAWVEQTEIIEEFGDDDLGCTGSD